MKLPADQQVPVVKPLPSYPTRQGEAPTSRDALPYNLLLIDVQQAACASIPAGKQLFCAARLRQAGAGPAVVKAPVRTRPVPTGADGTAVWQERLIVALPLRPSELRADPAPSSWVLPLPPCFPAWPCFLPAGLTAGGALCRRGADRRV